MRLNTCLECMGLGELMTGILMHPNPYNTSSYDEVWEPCPLCNGSGKSYRYFVQKLGYWVRELKCWVKNLKFRKEIVEEDIPF